MKNTALLRAAVAALAIAAAALPASAAKTFYVSTTGSSSAEGTQADPLDIVSGFGKAWNNANEIVILPGTYTISESLAVSGGGSVIHGSTENPADVIIDAQGLCPVMRLANSILVHTLTVTNGASGTLDDTAKNASGIRVGSAESTGSTIVSNCVVSACDNTLGESGGAVVLFGKGILVDSIVCGNTGTKATNPSTGKEYTGAGTGGGVNVGQSGAQIIRCTIRDNVTASHGAGVCVGTASSLTITNCLIANNTSTGAGAGIALRKANSSLTLDGCTISGNKAGSSYGGAIAIYTGNNVSAHDCTFSGNSAQYGGAVRLYGSGATLTAEGCTFENNSNTSQGGGAVYLQSGTTFNAMNCTFSGNASPYGGAVYDFETATFSANGCTFANNTATYSGGAIYMRNAASSFNVANCVFTENAAATSGGAVYIGNKATFSADGTGFSSNTAKNGGAVLVYQAGRLLASDCSFTRNSATYTTTETGTAVTAGGGAVNCAETAKNGDVWGGCYVTNSTFTANTSTTYGGAVSHTINSAVSWEFVNCKFLQNQGVKWGGAVCLRDSAKDNTVTQLFRQCLFASNSIISIKASGSGSDQVANAGALYLVSYANSVVDSCTFANNTATSAGAAIYHRWGGVITNSVIALNTINGNTDTSDYGVNKANAYNCVYPDSHSSIQSSYFTAARGNIFVDPKFVDAANGDYRLADDSPCKNAGVNEAWMATTADLAGLRSRDGGRIYGENVDIGAYEIYIPAAFMMTVR